VRKLSLILIVPLFCWAGLFENLLHYYSFDSDSTPKYHIYDMVGTEMYDQGGFAPTFDNFITIEGKKDSTKIPNYAVDSTGYIDFFDERWDLGWNTTTSMWFKFTEGYTSGLIWYDNSPYVWGLIAWISPDSTLRIMQGNGKWSSNKREFVTTSAIPMQSGWNHAVIQPVEMDTVNCFINGQKIDWDIIQYTGTDVSWAGQDILVGRPSNEWMTIVDEIAVIDDKPDSATIVDTLWNNNNGWFPFASEIDSFAIKINGRDLSTIPNINGRSIDNYYKRNGRLIRKE